MNLQCGSVKGPRYQFGATVSPGVAWLSDELISCSHPDGSSATVIERGPSPGPSEIELTAVPSVGETTIHSRVDKYTI